MSEHEDKGVLRRFATSGAFTERGGRVTTGSDVSICGVAVACVGDVVAYTDGSEAVIVDDDGFACVFGERSTAIVGRKRDA